MASTVNDDLALEIDLLQADNVELRAQVSALLDTIRPGPTGADIVALDAGGVLLANDGITLPLPDGSAVKPGAIIWQDSTFDRGTKLFRHQAIVQAYVGDASSAELNFTQQIGHFSSVSEQATTAYWSMTGYAKASTAPTSTNAYFGSLELNATDKANFDLFRLSAGQRTGLIFPVITVTKTSAGVEAGATYGIGLHTADPSTNASLDIAGVKPIIVPRMTSAQADAVTFVAGMIYYNTQSSRLLGYAGATPTESILSSG